MRPSSFPAPFTRLRSRRRPAAVSLFSSASYSASSARRFQMCLRSDHAKKAQSPKKSTRSVSRPGAPTASAPRVATHRHGCPAPIVARYSPVSDLAGPCPLAGAPAGGAHRRVERYGLAVAGPDLVITARPWLSMHEAIATLLGRPEPPEAVRVRATLRPLDEIRSRAAAALSPPDRPQRD